MASDNAAVNLESLDIDSIGNVGEIKKLYSLLQQKEFFKEGGQLEFDFSGKCGVDGMHLLITMSSDNGTICLTELEFKDDCSLTTLNYSASYGGELQRENKLTSNERAFKLLENDMYIAGIGQAVLQLLSFKVESGNHQRGISFRNFWTSSQEIDDELDSILDNHAYIDARVDSIQRLLPNLEVLSKDADHLNRVICDTSELAEKVSSKVRLLDLAKSRVQDTIKRVDDILDLKVSYQRLAVKLYPKSAKSCVEGVETALRKEEYEQAAAFIHRYLSLDERALREILPDNAEGTDLTSSFSFLHEARKKLENIVREKFDEALSSANGHAVERFFKLFPLVGIDDEGLIKFSKYLRIQIVNMASVNLDTAIRINPQDRRANVIFADTLTLLFEGIARIVEDHQPLVDTYYGPGKMITVLKELQEECDSQSQKVIEQFLSSRNFEKMFEDVRRSQKTSKSSSAEKLDPRHLDILLGEIVLLNARTELYLRFLRKRVKADMDSIPEDEKKGDLASIEDRLISNCGLSRKMQTLTGDYILMEEYFMKEMVLKAVSMDTTDGDSLTSSMVDDVFFIIQKSLRRTISTSNMDALCAMVNNASSLLLSDFREVLKTRIKSGFPLSSSLDLSGMLQGKLQLQSSNQSTDARAIKKNFLVFEHPVYRIKEENEILETQHYALISKTFTSISRQNQTLGGEEHLLDIQVTLNNIEVSTDNLQKLRNDIKNECEKLFSQIGSTGKEKVDSCLSDMSSCSQNFKTLLQSGISQLCTNGMLPKLNPIIDGFAGINHVLTEEDFSFYEVNDPFVQNFMANLDKLLTSLKDSLTPSNYDNVVGMVCSEVAGRLEKSVMKASFNRLGGLQFDKELRALVGYLTNITEWTVRDKFARLTQIATILNLEKVSELLDYWGTNSGPLTWRLTPAEVRQVLVLRVDFRTEDIRRLRL